jgi:hypothetical protein
MEYDPAAVALFAVGFLAAVTTAGVLAGLCAAAIRRLRRPPT